jgi:hypothetical protein
MDVIKEEIQAAIDKELKAACDRFPMFASLHEAYAVIKEEKEEAMDEFADIERFLSMAWGLIKQNQLNLALNHIKGVGYAAERLAIEACQISAMCKKAVMSAEHPVGEKIEDLENRHWGECMQIAHYDQELRDALYWLNYYTEGSYTI